MDSAKLTHGTRAWFEMVGRLMTRAAADTGLGGTHNVSLVERYTDGVELADGLVQGIRFDIVAGEPAFRIGVGRFETADVVVEITTGAARRLNALRAADPAYAAARQQFQETGEMTIAGDSKRLGEWLDAVHDPIVQRTQ